MSRSLLRRAGRGIVLALSLLGAARLGAQVEHEVPTTAGSDIAIRVSTPLRFAPHFGFFPLRVSIDNGSGQAGTWSIRLTSGDAAAFPGLAESTYALEVPAGTTGEQWYFAPLASPGVVATPDYDPDATPTLNSVLPARDPNTPSEIPPAATRATETAATAVLEPTGLLDTPWGVTETITTKNGVVTFAQTGSPGALIKPPAGSLPAGVLVNLHPSLVDGQVVRTITYVDPADLAALQEPPTSRVDAYRKAVNRNMLSLWRYGYLRENGALEITLPNNFGDRDGVVTTTVTETGPASLLTMPEPEALPPDTLVTVTAAAVPPGGVVRKFTVRAGSDRSGDFRAGAGPSDPDRFLILARR